MKLLVARRPGFKMRRLAGREDRCGTGAFVPVAECGLRDGVDNIGELSISRMANIPLRRMRILTSLRLQAKAQPTTVQWSYQ